MSPPVLMSIVVVVAWEGAGRGSGDDEGWDCSSFWSEDCLADSEFDVGWDCSSFWSEDGLADVELEVEWLVDDIVRVWSMKGYGALLWTCESGCCCLRKTWKRYREGCMCECEDSEIVGRCL